MLDWDCVDRYIYDLTLDKARPVLSTPRSGLVLFGRVVPIELIDKTLSLYKTTITLRLGESLSDQFCGGLIYLGGVERKPFEYFSFTGFRTALTQVDAKGDASERAKAGEVSSCPTAPMRGYCITDLAPLPKIISWVNKDGSIRGI